MRISTRKNRRRNERLTLNMASMIDCTFLLLAYFLLTIVVLEPEDQLSSNIQPEQTTASGARQDFQPQIIDVELVDSVPGYRLGSRLFRDADSLRAALAQLRLDSGPNPDAAARGLLGASRHHETGGSRADSPAPSPPIRRR